MIEIGTALTRNIPVVPVLVDGARMPKASELPDSLKPLARRQAIQVRHTNFSSDAEALVKKLREALGYHSPERGWRVRVAIGVAAVAMLLLIVGGGYALFGTTGQRGMQQASNKLEQERKAAETEAKRKADGAEAEGQRKVDADRKRKEGVEAGKAGDFGKALANLNEAIRLNPDSAVAYYDRGLTYSKIGDIDQGIANYDDAIRLDPNYVVAFTNRGILYRRKGDMDQAIADFSEAIRLNPVHTLSLNARVRLRK